MQNTGIIIFIEPHEGRHCTTWKAVNLYMNRLTIDEEIANELLRVYYLKQYHNEDFFGTSDSVKVEKMWYDNGGTQTLFRDFVKLLTFLKILTQIPTDGLTFDS